MIWASVFFTILQSPQHSSSSHSWGPSKGNPRKVFKKPTEYFKFLFYKFLEQKNWNNVRIRGKNHKKMIAKIYQSGEKVYLHIAYFFKYIWNNQQSDQWRL
jgi:hypothetical protein